MRVVVVTPPDPADVVSLEEAKLHLHVTHNDEDSLIPIYIAAALAHIDGPEGWLGRCIGVQTLEARLDGFCSNIRLPYPEVTTVLSVKYLDASGLEQTLPATDYETFGSVITPAYGKAWPSARSSREAVRIQYEAGYETVPEAIRAAILLMVGDLHANRETAAVGLSANTIPMSTTVENLLAPYRVYA